MDCFVFQMFWAWPFISEKFKYKEPMQLYISLLIVLFKVLVETVGLKSMSTQERAFPNTHTTIPKEKIEDL